MLLCLLVITKMTITFLFEQVQDINGGLHPGVLHITPTERKERKSVKSSNKSESPVSSVSRPPSGVFEFNSICLLWSLHFYMVKLKLRPTTPILSHATLAHALGINGCHSCVMIIKFLQTNNSKHSVMLMVFRAHN